MQATTVQSVEDQLLRRLNKSPIEARTGANFDNEFQRASGLTFINATNLWQTACSMKRQGLVVESVRKLHIPGRGGQVDRVMRIFDLTDKGRKKLADQTSSDFPS
jgi:hypothetical protein